MAKILLVEDDRSLAQNIRSWLLEEHHTVEVVHDGIKALEFIKAFKFDLIILDWNMPELTGISVVQTMRQSADITPVMMLTARNELNDKEEGFSKGADDYLTKPFHQRELNARIKALLRRAAGQATDELKLANLTVDPFAHKAVVGNHQLSLLPKEFALLEFFLRNPNKVFSGQNLLDRIWPSDSEASPNTVRSYVYTLKKKLAKAGMELPVASVYGVGYKLEAPKPGANE